MDKKNNTGRGNSGDRNSGDWNSGDRNSGDWNSGDRNSGDRNSGDWNSGDRNSGDWNSGDRNSGYRNSGYRNSGDRNSGDRNSGDWNSGDRNSGYLNSDKPTVRMFNKDTEMTYEEVNELIPNFFYFDLNIWIPEEDMMDKEKEAYPEYTVTGGYLKVREYKQAWKESWLKAAREDREEVKKLPNFDADIFYEISGIKVDDIETEEITMEDLCKELGREVKIKK